MPLLFELSVLLILVLAIGLVLKKLGQPLILAYLLVGIVLGPYGAGLIQNHDAFDLLSHVGVTMLLYIIGLHLSPQTLKNQGLQTVTLGLIQVVLTWVIGTVLTSILGFTLVNSLVVGAALSFSSTIVVLKILSDTEQIQTHFGQISTGILLVQDILVSILLILFAIKPTAQSSLTSSLLTPLLTASLLIVGIWLLAKFVLPILLKQVADNQELLFLTALAWGLGIAGLFEKSGLSIEIGALCAGVAIANSPLSDEIAARLRPLRDFFLVLFFVGLGSQLSFDNFSALLLPIVILSVFVLLVKPMIIFFILAKYKYHHQTGMKTAFALAQVSEFSLILLSFSLRDGLIDQSAFTLVGIVTFVAMLESTYVLTHLHAVYQRLLPLMSHFNQKLKTEKNPQQRNYDILLFGYNRVGSYFAKHFHNLGYKVAAVDITPRSAGKLQPAAATFFTGDAGDLEFLHDLPLTKVGLVCSTIPDLATNLLIVKTLIKTAPKTISVIFAQTLDQAQSLYQAGATYVVLPHHLAAKEVVGLIRRVGLSKSHFERKKELNQFS